MPRVTLRALTFGEALIDEFEDRRVVAGAPLHVAAHLAALGWEATLVTRVGDDDDGRWLRATLENHGVDTRHVETDPALPTGTVTVGLDDRGVPAFTVHGPVAWDAIEGPDPVPTHEALCFGTLPMRDPLSRAALERLLVGSTGLRAGDANLRDPDWDEEAVRLLVTRSDLLKVSDTELAIVSGVMGTTGDPADLTLLGPEWVCVTRGPDGASLHHRSGASWDAAGQDVDVIDTVGAGDAFLAGIVDGIVRSLHPADALRNAADLAVSVVQQRGGLPEPNVAGPAS